MSLKKIIFLSLIVFFLGQNAMANTELDKKEKNSVNRTYKIQLGITNVNDAEALGMFIGMVNSETFKPISSRCVISELKPKPERTVSFIHLPSGVLNDGYDGYIAGLNAGWPDSTINMTANCISENNTSALAIHAIGEKIQLKFMIVNDELIQFEKIDSDKNNFVGYVFNQ